jgi:predicted lipoprotein with Yx(FWY)xxD motif
VKISVGRLHHHSARRLLASGLAVGAAAVVAACSSSSSGSAAGSATSAAGSAASAATSAAGSATGAAASAASAPASAAAAGVTISAKSVPGAGTVLVNGQGRTLYLLTSEQNGKITCTTANGCTQVWPEITVASGTTATAGSGVQSSLLGTVKDASGNLEVTYNHWPLYTFSGDAGPGVAHGQRLVSFGGTWYVLTAAGNPATTGQTGTSPSPGGGNGY